jgi:flagellar biosynthesis/type III secretory pathway protein FliH
MDDYQCPDPIKTYKFTIRMQDVMQQKEKKELEAYWDGYKNGMSTGAKLGWETGFNAAVDLVSKLHAEINPEVLKSFIGLLDKSVSEKESEAV